MHAPVLLGLLSGLATLGRANANVRQTPRDYENNNYYLVELREDADPEQISQRLGLRHERRVQGLDHYHVFVGPRTSHDLVQGIMETSRLRRRSGFAEPNLLDGVRGFVHDVPRQRIKKRMPPPPPGYQARHVLDFGARSGEANEFAVAKQADIMKTLDISDPIFKDQWHLINTVQVGHDINVTGAWLQGYTGKGTIVAMVDDGIDMTSEDLKDNYYAEGSWDFNDPGPEPKPRLSDDHHGTRCAGEIAAVRNNVCGVGVAYDGKISGLRILSKIISDEDEAVAMTYDFQHNQIYSCSWGPPDDGRAMEAPGIPIKQAMLKGVQDGRGGLGSIYVFASGNGAANDDNCNFDGYTNSIYSITVGAIDRAGKHPYYSEKCSAQLVVTYSSGSGDAIHTTDVGSNKCYTGHGGTSAAAPLAAGIFALVLQARPDLTWRDMQYIVLNSAVPVDEETGNWAPTASGKKFSHTYGYGKVDTFGAIELAKTWTLVKPQAWYFSPWIHVNREIPQGKDGLSVSFEVTEEMLKEANLERLEHVTVTMNVNHTRRGDISVDLYSPQNVVSHIATTRKLDAAPSGYEDWTFMSVVHW
jgi:kexin